jgi:hypothetical protein
VLKLDHIKDIDVELKQLLAIDKKYLPIQKKLAVLLRGLNPFLTQIDKDQQQNQSRFLQESLKINRHYAENMEHYQRSLNVLIQKNADEIEKSQKDKHQKTHDLNQNLKIQLETIEQKVHQIDEEAKEKLEKADQIFKRELAQIQKVMIDARKVYQESTQHIESEKKESTELYKKRYDDQMKSLEDREKEIIEQIEQRRIIIKDDSQQAVKVNDEAYLVIKNTYSQLSISLNKKINELKKKYQSALATLEKEHDVRLKPILQSIEDLKLSYQEAQKKSLATFNEKMSSLSVIFDVQKTSYETKKERIIHEGNDHITLFNSKLSAFRETTQKEKLAKSREIRNEIKNLQDEHAIERKNHDLTQIMNQFDNELNKQIIRTNRDILVKKKETQRKLFDLDQKHLREINEWRLQKVLYEYEKKQDFAKIDLNFNHNLQASELMLKSEELTFSYQKDVLLQQHNKDLLPLEYQLSIGAAIQERELNLLANDAHVTIASFKHAEQLLDFELKKELSLLEFNRLKEKAHYDANLNVLNASTQLELEKEKVKRDFILSEQELRIELSQALFNKQKQAIQHDLNLKNNEINLERELVYLENKKVLNQLKFANQQEETKRHFIVNESRYKHQQRMSNEKAVRLLSTYKNELEQSQMLTENFFKIIYHFYSTDMIFKNALIELYHLPSHPEVFKGMIELILKQSQHMLDAFFTIIEQYQHADQAFYLKKIEDLTGYKYMLKHEDMMNYYATEEGKVHDKIKNVQQDIQALEEQFFLMQGDLERTTLHLEQLHKQVDMLKEHGKSDTKHQELKELHKEISNKEHDARRLKMMIDKLQKSMDKKHLDMAPLEGELKRVQDHQKEAESKLEKSKHEEASIFYVYLNKNKTIYEKITQDVKTYHETLSKFYHDLSQEVYVSDLFLTNQTKALTIYLNQFDKKLMLRFQQFLNLMLKFYQKNEREQSLLTTGFRKSTTDLIRSLNQTYIKQVDDINVAIQKQADDDHLHERTLRIKTKKASELEAITYKKALLQDQNLLKLLENKLAENQNSKENELKLIHENQLSTAQQYQHEHENKIHELQAQHDKIIQSIDLNITNAVKNHSTLDESITNKNEAILNKYENNHEKSMLNFKQKNDHIADMIEKFKENQTKRLQQDHINLKKMNQKRELELRNMQSQLVKFNKTTKRQQNHVLAKELRLLKKTHNSKVKMLHLN